MAVKSTRRKKWSGAGQSGGGGIPTLTVTANLSCWYDAADASSLTLVSGKVSQWNDKSGNGSHVSQSTAGNRPASGTNTLNGRNVITFTSSGSHHLVSADGRSVLQSCPGHTVFAVGRHTDSAASGRFIAYMSTAPGVGAFRAQAVIGIQATTQTAFFGSRRTFDDVASSSLLSASAWGTGYGVFCGTGTYTGTTGYFFERTTQLATSSSWCTAGNSPNTTGYIWIGCDAAGAPPPSSAFLNGDIAELLIYNLELSSADRATVITYLSQKWGL